ncbi:MAG: type I methionyl aminopeptidase [Candidatus Omnitrophota bacterium]
MIDIKSDREIALIEGAGKVVKEVLESLKKMSLPGVTTAELDKKAGELIAYYGARPAFKGYRGFPANICTSINEEIVHGIPDEKRILRSGDILSIDVGVEKDGYYADSAITIGIGKALSQKAIDLIEVARVALEAGIKEAVEGNRLFDISYAVQRYTEGHGYSVVRDFVGHGIGKKMHEEPEIPNFGKPGVGPRLKKGMVLAIEPMINEGGFEIEILDDNWTAVTRDRTLSAHFEHTICITDSKAKVLT